MLGVMQKPVPFSPKTPRTTRHPCCERCQGAGWIRMKLLEHRHAIGITCPVCRGEGRLPAAAGWQPPPRLDW
jgi:DnaJ-class molecular chaperone